MRLLIQPATSSVACCARLPSIAHKHSLEQSSPGPRSSNCSLSLTRRADRCLVSVLRPADVMNSPQNWGCRAGHLLESYIGGADDLGDCREPRTWRTSLPVRQRASLRRRVVSRSQCSFGTRVCTLEPFSLGYRPPFLPFLGPAVVYKVLVAVGVAIKSHESWSSASVNLAEAFGGEGITIILFIESLLVLLSTFKLL